MDVDPKAEAEADFIEKNRTQCRLGRPKSL